MKVKILSVPMGDGGKVKPPIYVNNPNDKRLQAYDDSLSLHNYYKNDASAIDRFSKIKPGGDQKALEEWRKINPPFPIEAYKRLNGANRKNEYQNEEIISLGDPNNPSFHVAKYSYPEPIQPVEFKSPIPKINSTYIKPLIGDVSIEQYTPRYIQSPTTPSIKRQGVGWYSNNAGVNIDATDEEIDQKLYNSEGNRKYGDGGKIKTPIYTNDPNDKRIQRYNDSLSAYTVTSTPENIPNSDERITGYRPYNKSFDKNIFDIQGIHPEKFLTTENRKGDNKNYEYHASDYPVYKQPVQPYVYAPYRAVETYPEYRIYNYPTQQQADSAVNSIANKTYQQGGQVMKQRVRIIGVPEIAYGGQIATPTSTGVKYRLDRSWNNIAWPSMGQAPDDYKVGRTLPEAEEGDPNNTITVEKNEQILGDFNQDGTPALMQVNTGSHASGNDQDVNVPNNAFVFSDTKALKIKDPATQKNFGMAEKARGYTPAEVAKKYNLQKYTAILANPQSDPTAKKTAELMVANYQKKLQELSHVQEGMKQVMNLDNKQPQFQMGGTYDVHPNHANLLRSQGYEFEVI